MKRRSTCSRQRYVYVSLTYKAVSKFFLVLFVFFSCTQADSTEGYANHWAVEIHGGDAAAEEVAYKHGFINHGKILQDENFYLFSHPKLRKRSLERSNFHHSNLISHDKVKWAEQQRIKRRVKRDLTYDPHQPPNDPRWRNMWYLLESKRPSMRVVETWQAGYTGKNVSVTILDDGIERTHPDLKDNYDPLASTDINSHDDDPTPRLNPTNENRHGTRCAGEVAAVANNNICSVGIAYDAKIGGVRMLDGQVTDAVEAASIGLRPQHVDIYSASWGPDDDGRTVDGPANLARKAFINGVANGRNGKGSIFVWASGNGGRRQDNCNCDGYTDSIYTLSISSTTERSQKPWYSEACSSTLAATYSSGANGEKQIVTTDLRHGCTESHTGTSASAPLAAAVCALALEANPDLTWRDMQHLVVQTARPDGLNADDWIVNGVKRKVSHWYGYGLLDAYGMVTKAKEWTKVPPQRKCVKSVISESQTPRIISSNGAIVVPVQMIACDGGEDMIERLEHVQAEITLKNERRGDLSIYLKSPMGTRSTLLGTRRQDLTSQGFTKWAFMTTHSWDEDPRGIWELEIRDSNQRSVTGTLSHYNIILYGTKRADWPEESRIVQSTTASTTTKTTSSKKSTVAPSVTSTSTTTTTATIPSNGDNCKYRLHPEPGCLACNLPTFLDPDSGKCVKSCPPGHYLAKEKVNEKGERMKSEKERKTSSEWRFEELEEEVFEDQERFYHSYVCRPCTAYCHSCTGPRSLDCHQCAKEADMRDGDHVCVLRGPITGSYTTSEAIITSICLILLICLVIAGIIYCCRSRHDYRPNVSYRYLSVDGDCVNGVLTDEMEYHDDLELSNIPLTNSNIKSSQAIRNGFIKNGEISQTIIGTDSSFVNGQNVNTARTVI